MPKLIDTPSLRLAAHEYGNFEPGATVCGIYRVDAKIGEGAFGEVWAGTTIATGERVALKRLHTAVAANVESFQRFRREAELLARVSSEYVAKLIDFLPDPNHGLVLVLEFIDGAPLSELFGIQTISVELAIDIGIDMLFALRDLHAARIIHRDIKPANVIMRPLPNGDSRAVLCDFSMSRLAAISPNSSRPTGSMRSMPTLTPSNVTLGTLHYMSPEQILSSRDVSERTDLYAVGAVLYRGVTGSYVFGEQDGPQSIVRTKLMNEAPPLRTDRKDHVARAFEEAIARALRRRPQDRYPNASDMLDAFLHLHKLAAEALESESSETAVMFDRVSLVGDAGDSLERALQPPPSQSDFPNSPPRALSLSEIPKPPPSASSAPPASLVKAPRLSARPALTAPDNAVSLDATPRPPSVAPAAHEQAPSPAEPPKPLSAQAPSPDSTPLAEASPPPRGVPVAVFVVALMVVFGLGMGAARLLQGPPAGSAPGEATKAADHAK